MNAANLKKIISLVGYFAVFDYPLTSKEISTFLNVNEIDAQEELNYLVKEGVLNQHGAYYGPQVDEEMVARREAGNQRAEDLRAKAKKNADLIARFPFVRGVFISGSYSKGFIGEDGDIDFFIVTKPGRLWVARTFLILYKKVFLLNSHEYFCVNYFVDENHLQIEEKNIFTATELVTLLPMVNESLFDNLMEANEWTRSYYPQSLHQNETIEKLQPGAMKRFNERVFGGRLGSGLDRYFMRLTLKRWQKKFGFLSNEDFEVAMKTTTNVSKHHPNNFQRKVLEKHQEIYSKLFNLLERKKDVETIV
jgi:predicted nucleotidyltransferase